MIVSLLHTWQLIASHLGQQRRLVPYFSSSRIPWAFSHSSLRVSCGRKRRKASLMAPCLPVTYWAKHVTWLTQMQREKRQTQLIDGRICHVTVQGQERKEFAIIFTVYNYPLVSNFVTSRVHSTIDHSKVVCNSETTIGFGARRMI